MRFRLLEAFLDNPSYLAYKNLSSRALPADIAEALKALSPDDRRRLLILLPSSLTADVFQELDIPLQIELLDVLGADKAAEIVSEMESDDAADLLSELEESDAQTILAKFDDGADDVKDLLKYEDDSSGGIMATEYVALNAQMGCSAGLRRAEAALPRRRQDLLRLRGRRRGQAAWGPFLKGPCNGRQVRQDRLDNEHERPVG
ncbi:MAG: hypothetical protein MZV65_17015 [Chromatiales bacterium]|nr:hypothetical protein [Chromatiales bacterium]